MRASICWAFLPALLLLGACGGGVDSEEAAEAAYLGLDTAIEKSLRLGFDGFNAASSANIPDQMTTGDVMGTLTVSGQVDQGASANKEMRLMLTMVEYQDIEPSEEDLDVVFDTAETLPALTLSLRNIPDGTLTGTLLGEFVMTGEIEGTVLLDLTITGEIESDPDAPGEVRRVPGTTNVTGTATSDYGTFAVDVTI